MYAHPYAPFNFYLMPQLRGLFKPLQDVPESNPAPASRPTCFKNIRTYRRIQLELFEPESLPSQPPLFFVAGVVAPRECAMGGTTPIPRESLMDETTDHGD
ncbi:MAG: hypothetical protein HZB71_08915 [Betaproteobacteria bacterium]|nr:hypothetical protein [Betaproteobacteria bacterium]